MKNKVDILDVDELVPVPADLIKVSDVWKKNVIKKEIYITKIKNIEDKLPHKIPDITNWATNTTLTTKINEVKNEYLILLT